MNNTVSLQFNWTGVLNALLALYENGDRAYALKQLQRMAQLADLAFKPMGINIYPMHILETGEYTLAHTAAEIDHYAVDISPAGEDPYFEREHLSEEEAGHLISSLCEQFPHLPVNDCREHLR
jgi:hypothetical protein